MRRPIFVACLVLAACFLVCRSLRAEEYTQVPLAMHMSSDISDGCLSIAQIVSAARQNNFRAVIINDRDLSRWEYGVWPLRGFLKYTVQDRSIFRYGINRYLSDIQAAARQYPDMVILGGTESAPFYYWSGDLLNRGLTMWDATKHLLVVGLEGSEDYAHLPVIGNPAGAKPSFDQYHGDQGTRPYQHFIDYARSRGACVFWAHPETAVIQHDRLVTIRTDAHPYDLLGTDRYTGFEIYYEGDQQVGSIGGVWDEVLGDYCAGTRPFPVWAVAGSGFDKHGSIDEALSGVRTVLLVSKLDKKGVLDALRSGRMYALKGSACGNFVLDEFVVRDKEGTIVRTMGQEYDGPYPPVIEVSGHFLDGQQARLTIQLIKNGKVLQVFEEQAPFNVVFEDAEISSAGKRDYYRVQIDSANLNAVTNPVFARRDRRQ